MVWVNSDSLTACQPISIKQIQTLKLKDGHFIIGDILTYEEYQKKLIIIEDGKNSLTLEENQKLSNKDKGNMWCIIAVVFIVLLGKMGFFDLSGLGGGGGSDEWVIGDNLGPY